MYDLSNNPTREIEELSQELANLRRRPCLTLVDPSIDPQTVFQLHKVLLEFGEAEAIDLVLHSPGGCICCGYAFARQLRRRFADVAVFVPLAATSAATLVALAGGDLVLGPLGELGPLDSLQPPSSGDGAAQEKSHLERTQALRHIHGFACRSFDEIATILGRRDDFSTDDARRVATEIVARLSEPLFSRIDPESLAESERRLETDSAYAERILRRYRPELSADHVGALVARLVHGYPSHSFVIDLEECRDIGLPARPAEGDELALIERFADAFRRLERGSVILGIAPPEASEDVVEETPPAEIGNVAEAAEVALLG